MSDEELNDKKELVEFINQDSIEIELISVEYYKEPEITQQGIEEKQTGDGLIAIEFYNGELVKGEE